MSEGKESPGAVGAVNPVTALCERVREIAQASGEESLRAKRQQAEAVIAEARTRTEAECRAQLLRVEETLKKQVARELQDARLEARARIANGRWSELETVLNEIERAVVLLRTKDPERYVAALHRFLQAVREQVAGPRLVVRVNAEDRRLLCAHPALAGQEVDVVEADIAAGMVVTTPDGNVVFDLTMSRQRQRLDSELRLALADCLFESESREIAVSLPLPGKRETGAVRAWRNTLDFAGHLIQVRGARDVGFDEQAEITTGAGSPRWGQVLATSDTQVVVQVFEGTAGLTREDTAVRFLGTVAEMVVGEELLGRVFDGLGRPRDGLPPLLGRRRDPLRGRPINPLARAYPRELIQTGISGIDVLNSLVRGQKLPIFTGSGLPHNQLLTQIMRQARLLDDSSRFAVVFVAMGVSHADARFFQDAFQKEGVMERVALFLNLADDPPVSRLAAPRAGLTAAEYLAFDKGYHVLVILTDMTHYADALREIATARNEVPARKGYPGYLYSDLAEIYERAGRIQGRDGSITLLPLVTLPNDDMTHPIPDLTGYITEGQLLLSRDLHGRGISPPLDVLPSLSRLMKDGIGPGRTRDDHAGLASQLYAAYAEGRRVRELAAVVGEADLAELDKLYLQFTLAFETDFLAQAPDEDRTILESLDRGWSALQVLPEEALTRVTEEQIRRHRRHEKGKTS